MLDRVVKLFQDMGIDPLRLLLVRSSVLRSTRELQLEGSGPEKLAERKETLTRLVRRERELGSCWD